MILNRLDVKNAKLGIKLARPIIFGAHIKCWCIFVHSRRLRASESLRK